MFAPWTVEMRAEQLILELRELLVRHDENLAAHRLLQDCVPYFLDDATHPAIAQARKDQAAMVDHIVGDSYADYYATNVHEQPFEEQYKIQPEEAHEHLHRVRYLRRWLADRERSSLKPTTLLDLACNDGWMAQNLAGLCHYTGIDLNPDCIERAKARKVAGAKFAVGAGEDVGGVNRPATRFDAVVAFEVVEHVRDPDALLAAMVDYCKPGGSLFVSTPLGACSAGDLPNWWHVEPKGHVRCYTPQTFEALLSKYGDLAGIEASDAGGCYLMVARVDNPRIVANDGQLPADRARRPSNPRKARGSVKAKR